MTVAAAAGAIAAASIAAAKAARLSIFKYLMSFSFCSN